MTKTTINNAIKAAEHPIVLQSAAQLEAAQRVWADKPILGIDTEFVRERTYRADLGLVQVSDGETAWLVDPLFEATHEPLAWLLSNPDIQKVLHSGSEDLEVLLLSLGALPDPLFDTQIACAMLGKPLQMGYHSAAVWLFEVEVDKDQTRSNWCKRPLTKRQLHYAAMDVVLLPEMLSRLKKDLQQADRWDWLLEDVARMQRNANRIIDPNEAFLRVTGANRLDEDSLRVLRGLASWREISAKARNLARGFIINDGGLMQIARLKPSRKEDLEEIDSLHPRARERYARVLMEIVEKALSDSSPLDFPEPFNERQRRAMKEMRKMVQAKAGQLEIDPALLASRRELEKLIRAHSAGEDLPERFMGWRHAVITQNLLSTLS